MSEHGCECRKRMTSSLFFCFEILWHHIRFVPIIHLTSSFNSIGLVNVLLPQDCFIATNIHIRYLDATVDMVTQIIGFMQVSNVLMQALCFCMHFSVHAYVHIQCTCVCSVSCLHVSPCLVVLLSCGFYCFSGLQVTNGPVCKLLCF